MVAFDHNISPPKDSFLLNATYCRSAIFYHAEEQKRAAEEVIEAVQPKFGSKIVTEVVPASDWYPADKGHQDYYSRNKSSNGYCRLVIHPKLSKVSAAC